MLEQDWGRRQALVELDLATINTLARPAFPGHQVIGTELLTEGHCNTNYKLTLAGLDEPFVLRVYRRDQASSQKDWDLYQLIQGRVPVPRMLYHDDSCQHLAWPYTIMTWAEGILLRDAIEKGDAREQSSYGYAVGSALAAIGSFTFPQAGFFGPGLDVEPFTGNESYLQLIRHFLTTGPTQERLGPELSQRLWNFVEAQHGYLDALPPTAALVHSDFKGINILVHEGEVSAVLDWEFAFAGSPLTDIANMLRYEHRMPEAFVSQFLRGYQVQGGVLPPDWHRCIKLLDLISLCEFAHAPEVNEVVVRDVIELMERTLAQYQEK